MYSVLVVLGIAMYVAVPAISFFGLRRWLHVRSERGSFFLPSLIGFGLGMASVLLVLSAMVWGAARGGFRYYDPPLMKIYGIGILLSLSGLLAGLGGVWKRNPLRWHAPILSLGMLLLWVLWASSE
jgi:hypothetical protein